MNKKIIYTTKYQMPSQNMVRFYQTPGDDVHNTMEYIPGFPRTGGSEFSTGAFNMEEYQNAIARDSLTLQNHIDNNWWFRNFGAGNQGHASTAGSASGNLQLNREWLHKLLGYDIYDTREAAKKLNKYQAPMSPNQQTNPGRYMRLDENKYSLHRQPRVKKYQVTDPGGSGQTGPYVQEPATMGPHNAPDGGGGGVNLDSNQLAGYANMVNFGVNAFSDPTKGLNTNPNANLQTTTAAPSDAPISTLPDDAPITFSENYVGNSLGINQLDYQDYQDIINGTVPADAGMGGHLGAGAQGAMSGASLGPVGAIVGFAVGVGGSMYGDSKLEDARGEIRESLTNQNQEVLGASTVAMKKANDEELARFLV